MNNEKLESLQKNIRNAIHDYFKYTDKASGIVDDISEAFIRQLARDSYYGKYDLRNMLRKSPGWNEELDAVVINGSTTHEPNYARIKNIGLRILANVLEEKEEDEFSDIYKAILFFSVPNDEDHKALKEKYLEALNRVAPKAYAPGKKLSRVFKALCSELGVVDNTAGSDFEKNFAKIADEMSAKKIDYKLFLSVNPAHFLTMSNPKGDKRGECLTSCHSLNNIEYDYNNGCIGYARDSVTMIAFTVNDEDNPEALNNRKTTRQLFMYRPGNGLLLQSRMYNTSGGTHGAQEETPIYRDLVQREISRCENAINLWTIDEYYDNKRNIFISAHGDFGGYADWDYQDFNPMISVRKDHAEDYNEFLVGEAGLCIMCGQPTTSDNGLYCDDCIMKSNGKNYICDECDNYADHLNSVYDDNGNLIEVCDHCLERNYGYCEICEEYHPIDSMHWVSGEEISVCDSCYNDEFETCNECGEEYRKDNMYEVINANEEEAYVCESCLSHYYIRCEDCDTLVHEDALKLVHDEHGEEHEICPDCLSRNYIECKECKRYFPYDAIEDDLCPECHDELPTCDRCGQHDNNLIEVEDTYTGETIEICEECAEEFSYQYKQVS